MGDRSHLHRSWFTKDQSKGASFLSEGGHRHHLYNINSLPRYPENTYLEMTQGSTYLHEGLKIVELIMCIDHYIH
jgi:hypothetical protein